MLNDKGGLNDLMINTFTDQNNLQSLIYILLGFIFLVYFINALIKYKTNTSKNDALIKKMQAFEKELETIQKRIKKLESRLQSENKDKLRDILNRRE